MDIYNLSAIYLACRRGLLELDIIIMSFFKDQYLNLSTKDKLNFIKLLELDDIELLNCLIYNNEPHDINFKPIVDLIRQLH
ncbi:MAG: succinate dehydrogenase assembly factor 2 [Candidatus Dasytiphilus stammeri]